MSESVDRKYTINPSFIVLDFNWNCVGFSERLFSLKSFLINQRLGQEVCFPELLIESIIQQYSGIDAMIRGQFFDSIRVISKFLTSFKFTYCQINNDFSSIEYDEIFENMITRDISSAFADVLFSQNISSFISSIQFLKTTNFNGFEVKRDSTNIHVNIINMEHANNYFPFFLPSPKHDEYSCQPNMVRGTVLSKDDENACYFLIKSALSSDSNSQCLYAYNKDTKNYLRFYPTGGNDMEFHAVPIVPGIDPSFSASFASRVFSIFTTLPL